MNANEPMRLVEFVFVMPNDLTIPYVGLFDAKDISSIKQHDKEHCILRLKDSSENLICGTLRTLTNRWIYALEKKHSFYQDEINRPSVMIYHRPETIGVDSAHFDRYQLKQLITALKPELFTSYPLLKLL